jgi:pyruvate/2-oxoglutarate dehydrogenase complex dihydrolipoamide acyltransferase (E2) component
LNEVLSAGYFFNAETSALTTYGKNVNLVPCSAAISLNYRKKFKEIAAEQGTKLTFLPYVVKALVSALKKYPALR